MWSNFKWVSRLRLSFLPSRTLGRDTLLLMIVARIKLDIPAGVLDWWEFGFWLSSAPGWTGRLLQCPDQNGFGVIQCFFINILYFYSTVFILERGLGEIYEAVKNKIQLLLRKTRKKTNLYNLAKFCFSAPTETSCAPSTDFAEETSSQSISMAAEWINH